MPLDLQQTRLAAIWNSVKEMASPKIPRFLPNVEKNIFVTSEVWRLRLESQPFIQEERSLRLESGSQGILDSIHFEDNEGLLNCIDDDEVGKVTAVGNFLFCVATLSM